MVYEAISGSDNLSIILNLNIDLQLVLSSDLLSCD